MATANWTVQQGQPADSVGADNDMSYDYTGRIQWGPKGSVTAGSWQGTAVNVVGPTGPGVLSTVGLPASSYGNNGNLAIDQTNGTIYAKSNNAWAQTGALAANIPTPALGTFAAMYGPSYWANGLTSTASNQPLQLQGTTFTTSFVAPANTAFVGYQLTSVAQSTATFNITLLDLSSGAALFGTTIAKGTVSSGSFSNTQYPLVAGDTYQWQISGAGTAYVALTPQWLTPATTGVASTFYATAATYPSQAISSTATPLFVPGTNSTIQQVQYYRNSKTSYLYQNTFIIGAGSGTVTFALTGPSVVYTSPTYTATSSQQVVNVGPFGPSTAVLTANTPYNWQVTGSGTIAAAVNMSVVQ